MTTITGVTKSARVDGEILDTVLRWDPADPLRVHVTWRHADGARDEWVIARELLRDGMIAITGLGDVVVAPAGNHLHVTLRARTADSETLAMDMGAVRRMLVRTHLTVPIGMEDIVVDVSPEGVVSGRVR